MAELSLSSGKNCEVRNSNILVFLQYFDEIISYRY